MQQPKIAAGAADRTTESKCAVCGKPKACVTGFVEIYHDGKPVHHLCATPEGKRLWATAAKSKKTTLAAQKAGWR
jgi:hypothetical protein